MDRVKRLIEVLRSPLVPGALVCALVVTSCGAPVASSDQALVESGASTTSALTTTSAAITSTDVTPTTSAVGIERWLVPPSDPPGLHLAEAHRDVVSDCGVSDCGMTVATATLQYYTDDPATTRSLRIVQSRPRSGEYPPEQIDDAPERPAGARLVRVIESSDIEPLPITAAWEEPGGNKVWVDALGISWDELAVILGGLEPIDTDAFPIVEAQLPPTRCVDAQSQLAPTFLPPGWQRFVLAAAPTGACGPPTILLMSVVLSGTADAPGTLVTIGTSFGPITTSGEPMDINGVTGYLQEFTSPDGQPAGSVSMMINGVAVDAHGTIDSARLIEIVASIRPFDDAEWAALVESVQQPP